MGLDGVWHSFFAYCMEYWTDLRVFPVFMVLIVARPIIVD